ncbi:hypothetical protein AB1N83_004129 [Pleurotus pulmonarius]
MKLAESQRRYEGSLLINLGSVVNQPQTINSTAYTLNNGNDLTSSDQLGANLHASLSTLCWVLKDWSHDDRNLSSESNQASTDFRERSHTSKPPCPNIIFIMFWSDRWRRSVRLSPSPSPTSASKTINERWSRSWGLSSQLASSASNMDHRHHHYQLAASNHGSQS